MALAKAAFDGMARRQNQGAQSEDVKAGVPERGIHTGSVRTAG
jgi:hypothetical protein